MTKRREGQRRRRTTGAMLRWKYGITLEDYRRMYASQQGRCAICLAEYSVLSVDHDHETGAVRGLLCRDCNFAIGLLHDKADLADSAARYLRAALSAKVAA